MLLTSTPFPDAFCKGNFLSKKVYHVPSKGAIPKPYRENRSSRATSNCGSCDVESTNSTAWPGNLLSTFVGARCGLVSVIGLMDWTKMSPIAAEKHKYCFDDKLDEGIVGTIPRTALVHVNVSMGRPAYEFWYNIFALRIMFCISLSKALGLLYRQG